MSLFGNGREFGALNGYGAVLPTLAGLAQFAQMAEGVALLQHLLLVHDVPFGWALEEPKDESLIAQLHHDLAAVHRDGAQQELAEQVGCGLVSNGADEVLWQKLARL